MTNSDDLRNSRHPDTHVTSVEQSVTVDVAIAVSNALGTAPDDLEPLESVIDTEALESLVANSDCATVEFTYEGCTVTVTADDTVRVDPPNQSLP